MNNHGGKRAGAGRPKSMAKLQKLEEKAAGRLVAAMRDFVIRLSDEMPGLLNMALDTVSKQDAFEVKCRSCGATGSYPRPMPDKDMLKYLMSKFFQLHDVADDEEISGIAQIQKGIRSELERIRSGAVAEDADDNPSPVEGRAHGAADSPSL